MCTEKISIIIPVYNGDKYINTAIKSIVEQTYHNFELLIVDDGSTDLSGQICDQWAEKDARVVCVHQENSGVSAARNCGIELATGKYIMFCDADDWMDCDYLENLLDNIGENQIAISSFQQYAEVGMQIRNYAYSMGGIYNKSDFFNDCANGKIYTYTVWGKLIDRELIGCCRFVPMSYSEDAIFIRSVFAKCDSAIFIESSGYHYRINQDSVTSDKTRIEEKSVGSLALILHTLIICKEYEFEQLSGIFENKLLVALLSYLKAAIMNPVCNPKKSKQILNTSIKHMPNVGILYKIKLILLLTLYSVKCRLFPKMLVRRLREER